MLPSLRNVLDSPLDVFTREFDRALFGRDGGTTTYPVDIRENDDAIVLEAELPGFTKNEIEITTEEGVLTISATHKREREEKSDKVHLSERSSRKVTRSFRFPHSVDMTKVNANLTNGILVLTLPKTEEVKPRRIEVK